jgi:hypothetical protein
MCTLLVVRSLHAADIDQIEAAHARARARAQSVTARVSLTRTSTQDPEIANRELDTLAANPGASPSLRHAVEYAKKLTPVRSVINERVDYVVDPVRGRFRAEVRDLRDLPALMEQGQIGDDQLRLGNVSRDGVSLQQRELPEGLLWAYHNETGRSMTLEFMGNDTRTVFDPPLDAGTLSPGLFPQFRKGVTTIERTKVDGADMQRVTSTSSDTHLRYEILLDPSHDYRLRLLEIRDSRGRLTRRVRADDYRNVNGFPYPFTQTTEKWEPASGRLISRTTDRLASLEFGIQLADGDFAVVVPEGTKVTAMPDKTYAVDYRTERTQAMTLSELVAITQAIKRAADQMGEDRDPAVLTGIAIEQWGTYGRGTGGGDTRELTPLTPPPRRKTVRIDLPGTRAASQPAAGGQPATRPAD